LSSAHLEGVNGPPIVTALDFLVVVEYLTNAKIENECQYQVFGMNLLIPFRPCELRELRLHVQNLFINGTENSVAKWDRAVLTDH
jgi:hypothetical protein